MNANGSSRRTFCGRNDDLDVLDARGTGINIERRKRHDCGKTAYRVICANMLSGERLRNGGIDEFALVIRQYGGHALDLDCGSFYWRFDPWLQRIFDRDEALDSDHGLGAAHGECEI